MAATKHTLTEKLKVIKTSSSRGVCAGLLFLLFEQQIVEDSRLQLIRIERLSLESLISTSTATAPPEQREEEIIISFNNTSLPRTVFELKINYQRGKGSSFSCSRFLFRSFGRQK